MKDTWRELDDIPVTLVIAIAYGTLQVVTNPFGPEREFAEKLHAYGWLSPNDVVIGESWRLLSHAFLHGGAVHLLFNLASLIAFGPALERSLGSGRFLLLYVVAALGGAFAVCVSYPPNQPIVGGSGALFGLMGAAMAMNMRAGRHLLAFLDFEGPRRLVGSLVANLVLGMIYPLVSNTAHVGGLIAGFLLTFLWLRPGDEPSRRQRAWRLASGALFASAAFASFCPVVRPDWLLHAAEHTPDPARRQALERAAERAMFGVALPDATEAPRDDDAPRGR